MSDNPFAFDLDDDLDPLDNELGGKPPAASTPPEDDIKIPKARYDEETHKLREQNAALQAALQAAKPPEPKEDPVVALQAQLDALEDQYEDAVIEGDKVLSKQLRAQLRAVRDQIGSHQRASTTHEAASMSREEMAYQNVVTELERDYPVLNSNHKSFDSALTDEVLALMSGLVQRGMPRAEALRKAATRLAPPPTQSGLRDAASRARNADAARRQPPSSPGLGAAPTDESVEISRLTPEEVAKMDARKLSILRGDYLE